MEWCARDGAALDDVRGASMRCRLWSARCDDAPDRSACSRAVARRVSVANVELCLRAARAVVLKCGDATACRCTRLMLPVISAEIAHALVRSASLLGAASPHRRRRGATSNQPIQQWEARRARYTIFGRPATAPSGPSQMLQHRIPVRFAQPGTGRTHSFKPPEANFVPAPSLTRTSWPRWGPAFERARPADACSR